MSKRTIILKAEVRETLIWLDDWFKQKIVEEGNRSFTPTSILDEVDDDVNYWDAILEVIKKAVPKNATMPEDMIDKDFVRKFIVENTSLIAEFSDLWVNEAQLILLVQAQYSLIFDRQPPTPFEKNLNVFSVSCHRVGEHRTQVRVTCHVPEVVWILDDLLQDIDNAFEAADNQKTQTTKRDEPNNLDKPNIPLQEKPTVPQVGSRINVWFDYYHAMKKDHYKITFAELAKLSGYSENTFKQAHIQYKLERGID